MKQLKLTKEKIGIILVLILSGILNLVNLSIENYGNEYYAAGVKSMVLNFKNFSLYHLILRDLYLSTNLLWDFGFKLYLPKYLDLADGVYYFPKRWQVLYQLL